MQQKFPYGTFAVNILGCLLIGVISGLVLRYGMFGPGTRIFLFTGLIGGFTTFSAFGLETVFLLRRGEFWIAGGYVAASILPGLGAIGLGIRIISLLPHEV